MRGARRGREGPLRFGVLVFFFFLFQVWGPSGVGWLEGILVAADYLSFFVGGGSFIALAALGLTGSGNCGLLARCMKRELAGLRRAELQAWLSLEAVESGSWGCFLTPGHELGKGRRNYGWAAPRLARMEFGKVSRYL